MAELDHSLIHEARKFLDGANVHDLTTWISFYETSQPNTLRRDRFEQVLRIFVATSKLENLRLRESGCRNARKGRMQKVC